MSEKQKLQLQALKDFTRENKSVLYAMLLMFSEISTHEYWWRASDNIEIKLLINSDNKPVAALYHTQNGITLTSVELVFTLEELK